MFGAGLDAGSGEQASGDRYESTGSGTSPPPPPPDTTLEELTTWVIVIVGVCLLVLLVVGLGWVAEGDAQPYRGKKREGWLVWNGSWYKMQKRKVTVLQKEDPTSTPVLSVRKPGQEMRPLIYAKPPARESAR